MDESIAHSVQKAIIESVHKHLDHFVLGSSNVEEKTPRDLVTQLDRAIGTDLANRLTTLLPHSAAYTEDGSGLARPHSANRWIIDPICGTANYVMGNTHFATSVALEVDRAITAGFVYHAPTRRMYWSIGPGQAYVNNKRLIPSKRSTLQNAYVVFGFSANFEHINKYHREWEPAFDQSRKAIGLLAPSLNICSVAAGYVDVFVDSGCSMEGQAAGGIILHNAGGTICDYDGGPWNYTTKGVYASNGLMNARDLLNPSIQFKF